MVLEQDTFYPSLVLVQPRKTHPCLTERLLMERKESNQTKHADNQDWHNILCFLISSWSLFQVQSYLTLSIINYGISKHYAGSLVSDRCPLGYLFKKANRILQSPPSVCPSLLLSPPKSNQIPCVSQMKGVCNGTFFGPAPWGGAKRSNIIKYH